MYKYSIRTHNKNLQTDKLTKPWNVATPQPKSLSIAAEVGVRQNTERREMFHNPVDAEEG